MDGAALVFTGMGAVCALIGTIVALVTPIIKQTKTIALCTSAITQLSKQYEEHIKEDKSVHASISNSVLFHNEVLSEHTKVLDDHETRIKIIENKEGQL